jgi:hypothetical protein
VTDTECAVYATITMLSVGALVAWRRWPAGVVIMAGFLTWIAAFLVLEIFLGVSP